MRDVQVGTPVITMHYSLAQAQLQIPGETLRDVQTDASADTLPDTLAKLKSKKVGETLTDMKIASQVLTLAGTLADVQTKTVAIIYVTCWSTHWPTLLSTRYHKLWPKKLRKN